MNATLRLFWNRVIGLMFRTKFVPLFSIILLLTGLICFCSLQAMAQSEPSDEEITDTPRFIVELVSNTELKPRQVVRMRNSGAGWGNIMIATRLAERIAADSEGLMTFDEALADVIRARAAGKGFGQIANENDLKLGRVLSGKDDTLLRRDLQGEDDTPLERDLEGEDDTPDSTNPPPFIVELVRKTELNRRQVERMRNSGAGWGNIMISARLAERIAADSEGLMTFDEALGEVFRSRAEGKGFGQIANENDLKLGRVLSGKDDMPLRRDLQGEDDTPLERDLEGEDDTPDSTNPPPFIVELIRKTELNRNQVERMRNSGAGWGNIMISARLAERIVADSEGLMTFDEALADVFRARAEGKGFGQIANENDLKLGRVLSGKDDTPLRRDLESEDDTPDSINPPPFIVDLVRNTELNRNQVLRMRNSGVGWGNIMITTRLAERIAADSEGLMTFDEALADVFRARTEGMGFGEIAHENDLKLGRVIGKGNKNLTTAPSAPETEESGTGSAVDIERRSGGRGKQNALGRFARFLGLGNRKRYEKPPKAEKFERPDRPRRPDKPERPEKPEKLEKPERPEKPEKPEKPARPGR